MIQVGVGVIIVRDNRILLGERTGAHGAGTWALPGGQLELGETIEECARREVREETGLELASIVKYGFTNDILEEDQMHCVTLYVSALCPKGEAKNLEPDYCKQWQWFDMNNLPQPLFLPLASLFRENSGFSGIG